MTETNSIFDYQTSLKNAIINIVPYRLQKDVYE